MKLAACGVAPAPGRPARAFSRGRENGNYKADANAGGMRGNSQRALPFPQKEAAGRFDGRPACRKTPPAFGVANRAAGADGAQIRRPAGTRAFPCPETAAPGALPSSFKQPQVEWGGRREGALSMKRRHTEAKKKRQRGGRAYRAAVYAASVLALLTVLCTGAAIVWKSDALLQGLAVTPALQEPALPNGCEAASLASVLDYYGLQADMLDLAYGYIPRQDFYQAADGSRIGPNPETAYPGDPASLGFYCFAGALCEGANTYLQKAGSSLRAYDVTGITEAGLAEYLAAGTPVIVWVTTDWQPPRAASFTWLLEETGEAYTPYANLHCLVLTAMGETKCKTADPLRGEQTVKKQVFLDIFAQVGSRAVVVH